MVETERKGIRRFESIQRWFQAVITDPDGVRDGIASPEAQRWLPLSPDEFGQVLLRSTSLNEQQRIAIYSYAYHARLIECLGEFFPALKRAVGEEVFGSLAVEYLRRWPSRSYTLDHLGDYFSRFLEEIRTELLEDEERNQEPGWPDFLVDLARLEWTIARVFDGPGVEKTHILVPEELQGLSETAFANARLVPVACMRLLEFRYPVNDYYTAARSNPEIPIPDPSYEAVAITRRDYVVRRYTLTRPQKTLLEALQTGRTVGQSITEMAGTSSAEDDELAGNLQIWFRDWTAQGFFQSLEPA